MQEDESLEYDTFMTSTEITALFEDMCPETPNFLSAYKQRGSEISRLVEPEFFYGYNLSLCTALVEATNANSPFSSHYRVAVHLHLLACIIALGSDAKEATSTWETIVALRTSGHAALRRGITRSQLAMWDSSARAWIETGDRRMSKEKSQLDSLLQHVELAPWKAFPIIAESYTATQRVSALINAWFSALTIMENLTSGQPQEYKMEKYCECFQHFICTLTCMYLDLAMSRPICMMLWCHREAF